MNESAVKRRPGRPRKNPEDTSEHTPARRERTPLGGYVAKLDVRNKDPNFYYHWIVDKADRVARAKDAGYEFVRRGEVTVRGSEAYSYRDIGVEDKTDDRICVHGGVGEFGREYKQYLMKLPMELRKEDLLMKRERTLEVDRTIQRQHMENVNVANKYGNVSMTAQDQE